MRASLTVHLRRKGPVISPMLHGIFFEDINYGADGGLYAELIQNRSFEHGDRLDAWTVVSRGGAGRVSVATEDPIHPNNPHFLRIEQTSGRGELGASNEGFEGIPVKRGAAFRFSVRARGDSGMNLNVMLEDESGRPLGRARLKGLTRAWKSYKTEIVAERACRRARLVVLADGRGRVDLDVVSLFPAETWPGQANMLRADLVQMLAVLRPAFMRFPGGCIVEGKDLANAYRWKETIGDIAERKQNWNRWQNAISTSPAPRYHQTYGLGFYEYFLLCEDLGAEPLPVINCGMSCQYQDAQLVPLDKLQPWIQDALDLIEFANGPVTSEWGARRAALGHPEPFHLKYLGVGNEQWGEAYFERYRLFYDALKAKYPDLQIVSSSGPGVDDKWWELAWKKFRAGMPADLVDEHYYRKPEWFFENVNRYDRQNRRGPKVFAGEFAAHETDRRSTLRAALAEAAFMCGLVRNADVVHMACYAPLFNRAGFSQWAPDLIWFDATRAYGTPSFHVQALFAAHRGDRVVPSTVARKDLHVVATRDEVSGELILKVVNPTPRPMATAIRLDGAREVESAGRAVVLSSRSLDDVNSFADPVRIAPKERNLAGIGPVFRHTFPAHSLTVLRLRAD